MHDFRSGKVPDEIIEELLADDNYPPVVLDLNNDGAISLIAPYDSAALVEIRGDGFIHRTGWVGPGDGMLVYDRNGDGRVTFANELSFTGYVPGARTDLEGLRHFDSNGDGRLDSRDREWSKFRIWKDANSNGSVDAGEMVTPASLGLASLNLTASGAERTVNGNIVYGTTAFTRTDGSSMAAWDVGLGITGHGVKIFQNAHYFKIQTKAPDGTLSNHLISRSGSGLDIDVAAIPGIAGFQGTSQADTIRNSSSRGMLLHGGDGNDSITGGNGNDILIGGKGKDTLTGGGGRDVFVLADRHSEISQVNLAGILRQADVVTDFTAGIDRLRMAGDVTQILQRQVSDASGARGTLITGLDSGGAVVHFAFLKGFTGSLTGGHFENGSGLSFPRLVLDDNGNHVLRGTARSEYLYGGDGNDWLFARGGNDWLYGGGGNDILYAHEGADRLFGGDGNDQLYGHFGRDILTGGTGRDKFGINDTVARDLDDANLVTDFTQGEDWLYAHGRPVWFRAVDTDGDGRDDATALYNNPFGEWGIYAVLQGFTGNLTMADFYTLQNQQPLFVRPTVTVNASENGGIAPLPTDSLVVQNGTQGADNLSGAGSNDYLSGHGGNDRLYGHAGDDVLDGGIGDDRLWGHGGRDILTGGAGSDIFFLNIQDRPKDTLGEADIITDFKIGGEADRIHLGRNINAVWMRRQDVDGDGRRDTVLYDNAEGNGGIHAILLDFSGPLGRADFYDSNVTTVTEIA